MFAACTTDSLFYLADVDERSSKKGADTSGVHPDALDLAFARWACGSAVTAFDLSAGGLGRLFLGPPPDTRHERSMNDFKRERDRRDLHRESEGAAEWIAEVWKDSRYRILLDGRHPLTHSRLTRTLSLSE